jgi:hypothetical protein
MGHQAWQRPMAWLMVGVWLLGGSIVGGRPRELRAGEVLRSGPPSSFLLTVEDGVLSLRAQSAPLKAIIEEIGRRLHIETVVQISSETRVTMAFDRISLAQAIKELRKHANVAYLERGAGEEGRRMMKILAFPKRAGEASTAGGPQEADTKPDERPVGPERRTSEVATDTDSGRSGGFKFEFDPSQVMPPGR